MDQTLRTLDGALLREMAVAALAALERERARIDGLNVFPVPDGDTGTNMALTLRAALPPPDCRDLAETARAMARGALRGARGNSGTILSQFVYGFSRALGDLAQARPYEVARALQGAVEAAYNAVAEPREGTMLTVGRAGAEAALAAAARGADLLAVWEAALTAAAEALERTPELLPVLKEAGVVDAGGEGLVVGARAALEVLRTGQALAVPGDGIGLAGTGGGGDAHSRFAIEQAAITFTYCTEFLVSGEGIRIEQLRAQLAPLGDSLLVVGDENLVKVHLHTDHPGRALEIGCAWGELSAVNIENMKEQNKAAAAAGAGERTQPVAAPKTNAGSVAVVTVSFGRGFRSLFESCGATAVVDATPTRKPSSGDLLDAIESCGAGQVILIPAHKDVVLSAQQAASLSSKEVSVLPVLSSPAAVSAIVQFDPEKDLARNVDAMLAATAGVRVAEVARAARDSTVDGVAVRMGQYLAFASGRIVAVESDLTAALKGALDALQPTRESLVTLYYGEGVAKEEAGRHAEQLRNASAAIGYEIEVYEGGQSAYEYWIAVE